MAREDVDFVVCLGDYIYAETYHARRARPASATTRSASPTRQNPSIVSEAADARRLPRQVRALPLRQGAAQTCTRSSRSSRSGTTTRSQDNYAGHAPGGGLDAAKHFTRRAQEGRLQGVLRGDAVLPDRARAGSTASCSFGTNVDLIMLDQRQYRDDQPCGDATVAPCAELRRPARLPRRARRWPGPSSSSRASKAAWKVVGNEVMMMNAEVLGGAYFNFDSWQGYATEREELLDHVQQRRSRT